MLTTLRELLLLPSVGLGLLIALPTSSAASVVVDFTSMGTLATPVVNFADGNVTADDGVAAANVNMLNLNGLGVVGGSSNNTVDGAEALRFQFSAVVSGARYNVQLANNLNGNGLLGESTVEAFSGAASLGILPVNGTGLKDVSAMFGGVGITSFVVRANVDGVRISRLEYTVSGTLTTPFCLGDGSGAACPCVNTGTTGRGCANSAFAGGAFLSAFGNAGASATTDTLVLTATEIPGPGLFFQASGVAGSPLAFGDGLLCATAGLVRMGVVFPSAGSASYPGGTTPNPIHVAGAPIQSGDTRHYQCWYRDAAVFCTGDTFNLTQGLTLTWGP